MRPVRPVFEIIFGDDPTAGFVRNVAFVDIVGADVVLFVQVVID